MRAYRGRPPARPSVVVVGESKRGKSSLVNALLGRPGLSPVGNQVVTSAYLVFRQGESEQALVPVGPAGEPTPMPLAELGRWACGAAPQAGVTRIDVTVTAPILDGLILVDTPGVGGLVAGHAAITLRALEDATALVRPRRHERADPAGAGLPARGERAHRRGAVRPDEDRLLPRMAQRAGRGPGPAGPPRPPLRDSAVRRRVEPARRGGPDLPRPRAGSPAARGGRDRPCLTSAEPSGLDDLLMGSAPEVPLPPAMRTLQGGERMLDEMRNLASGRMTGMALLTPISVIGGVVGGPLTLIVAPLSALSGLAFLGISRKYRNRAQRRQELRAWAREAVAEAGAAIRTDGDDAFADARHEVVSLVRVTLQQRTEEVKRALALSDHALRQDRETRARNRRAVATQLSGLRKLATQTDQLLTGCAALLGGKAATPTQVSEEEK